MARYWVGGTGTWDASDTTHWSATSGGAGGETVPGTSDDVFFDSASNATAYTVTTATGIQCRDLNISGPASGNVTWANTNFGILIYGSLVTAASGITWNLASGTFTFKATSTGKTITTNGLTLANSVIFDGVGGSWILQDNYTTGSNRSCTVTNGTLDLNGKTLSCGIVSSSNSNVRTIAFGTTGQFTITGSNATVLTLSTSTNLTITGTPVVNLTYSGGTGTRTINPGALTEATALSVNISAGTDTVSSDSPPDNFNNLNFTGFAGTFNNTTSTIYGSLTISTGMTLQAGTNVITLGGTSGTNTITLNGKTLDFPVTITGTGSTWNFADALTVGSTRTLTIGNGTVNFKAGTTNSAGTFAITGTIVIGSTTPGTTYNLSQTTGVIRAANMTISDSKAIGGAYWEALPFSSNADGGNNTGWNFGVAPGISKSRVIVGMRIGM